MTECGSLLKFCPDRLMLQCVQPFATFLYPLLGQGLDSHHGFVVEYELGKDINLGFHVDDSEVRLQVNLHEFMCDRDYAWSLLTIT